MYQTENFGREILQTNVIIRYFDKGFGNFAARGAAWAEPGQAINSKAKPLSKSDLSTRSKISAEKFLRLVLMYKISFLWKRLQ